MMEAVRISETSVDNHFTRQYIPEDNSEQSACSVQKLYEDGIKNLRSPDQVRRQNNA
jgi:hypothetical protein